MTPPLEEGDFFRLLTGLRERVTDLSTPLSAPEGGYLWLLLRCLEELRERASLRSTSLQARTLRTIRETLAASSPRVDRFDILPEDSGLVTTEPVGVVPLLGCDQADETADRLSRLQLALAANLNHDHPEALHIDRAAAEIDAIVDTLLVWEASTLTPLMDEKAYQAWVLAYMLQQLHSREGFRFWAADHNPPTLKQRPRALDDQEPCFVGRSDDRAIAVWTDIMYTPDSRKPLGPVLDDQYSLDVVVTPVTTHHRSRHPHEVLWAVNCTPTSLTETTVQNALNLRHDLSALAAPTTTMFSHWPATEMPANPPSIITVCSSDPATARYYKSGKLFGIQFKRLDLPA